MIISIREILDIIIMTAAVGYIFMDLFKAVRTTDPVYYTARRFDWNNFKFACLVTAPALIFHELAHKFFAVGYGLGATFHAAYIWLGIGIVLKLLRSNFIFFVPGFVSIGCVTTDCIIPPFKSAMIAGAGPFFNLVLFLVSWILLKKSNLKRKTRMFLYVTKQINLFLFIFNMLPIPLFDGFKFYSGLIQAIF